MTAPVPAPPAIHTPPQYSTYGTVITPKPDAEPATAATAAAATTTFNTYGVPVAMPTATAATTAATTTFNTYGVPVPMPTATATAEAKEAPVAPPAAAATAPSTLPLPALTESKAAEASAGATAAAGADATTAAAEGRVVEGPVGAVRLFFKSVNNVVFEMMCLPTETFGELKLRLEVRGVCNTRVVFERLHGTPLLHAMACSHQVCVCVLWAGCFSLCW